MKFSVTSILATAGVALSILLSFPEFLSSTFALLGVLSWFREWRTIPAVIPVYLVATAVHPAYKLYALVVIISYPLLLLSVKFNKVSTSTFFSASIAFPSMAYSPLVEFLVLTMTLVLISSIEYRGVVISALAFLIASCFYPQFYDVTYFYLLSGVLGAILGDRLKLKEVGYLSAFSTLSVLLYPYSQIPAIFLSLGFALFYPFVLPFSMIALYFEGFKYALLLIPAMVIPLVWKSLTPKLTLISIGIGYLIAVFPPLIVPLIIASKYDKYSLLVAAAFLGTISALSIVKQDFTVLLTSLTGAVSLALAAYLGPEILGRVEEISAKRKDESSQ
ncbi:MAG: hypothetical protein MPF33_02370 [Candidatus Aramenus sp.]|jgi:hypothetical protein|nr:hypothetical protein [Candidatus Aramenus sp.]